MTKILEVKNLEKKYGDKKALDNVSFSVHAGSCFGLLGPNGAGKSTTMRIITGIESPDKGSADLFGETLQIQRKSLQKEIGYVPQTISLYEKLTALDNLTFFGEMYGLKGTVLKSRIAEVLQQTGLVGRAKEPVKNFSGGMKRRINIAAALLHNPRLLILDEPTVGIDPQSRNHIFEMIRQLKEEGVTIVYSTHYMEEVEALCDNIAIIDNGKVITQGSLSELFDSYSHKAVYIEADCIEQDWAAANGLVLSPKGRGFMIETDEPLQTMERLIQEGKTHGWNIKGLEMMRPSLESVFLSLTGTTLRD